MCGGESFWNNTMRFCKIHGEALNVISGILFPSFLFSSYFLKSHKSLLDRCYFKMCTILPVS